MRWGRRRTSLWSAGVVEPGEPGGRGSGGSGTTLLLLERERGLASPSAL